MTKGSLTRLDYGRGAGRLRLPSRRGRLVLVLALGAGLIVGAVWFRPGRRAGLWRRLTASQLRADMDLADKYQRELTALGEWRRGYVEPADALVYEEGPASTPGQWASPAGRMMQLVDELRPERAVRVRLPRPPPLCEAAGHYPFPATTGVLLLGQLRTPKGAEVPVVVLRSVPRVAKGEPWPSLFDGLEQVDDWRATTPVTSTPYHVYDQCFLPQITPGQVLRMYAGQRDPADPSHFTVNYELDGKKGVIDGWLRDDLKMYFRVRDGAPRPPEAPPADADRRYRRSGPAARGG